jgi:hypothetical protein
MKREKEIIRIAKKAGDDKLHTLYMEVYGADFAGAVTPERARASIITACKELLSRGKLAAQPEGQEIDTMTTEEFQTATLAKLDRILSVLVPDKQEKVPEKVKAAADKVIEDSKITDYVKANPKCKASDLIREFKISQNRAAKFLASKKEEKTEEITIEMLREMATKYSAAFGMEALLSVNVKFGGAKKLSACDPASYSLLWNEMKAALDRAPTAEAPALSLDEVKAKAKGFVEKNGAPALSALLKAFGAEKLGPTSEGDPRKGLAVEKYAALVEAIDNA